MPTSSSNTTLAVKRLARATPPPKKCHVRSYRPGTPKLWVNQFDGFLLLKRVISFLFPKFSITPIVIFFLYKYNRLPMDLMKESGCGVTQQKCPPQLDTGWKSGWRHWQRFKLMWWIPFTIPCLPFFDSVPSVVLKPSGIGAGRTLKRFPAPEWAAWSCSLLDRYLAFFASFRNGSTAN